jgi:hypothetical protein
MTENLNNNIRNILFVTKLSVLMEPETQVVYYFVVANPRRNLRNTW